MSNLEELRFHLTQGNQREDRLGILVGSQCGIGPELIGGLE